MHDPVRIGVIGAGDIFRHRHFPALVDMDDVSIVAIANRSVESAREIDAAFDLGAEIESDPDAVFNRPDIDAVMIGTWPYRHADYTLAALDRGKHVFVQARMATSLAEAKTMLHRAEETDLITQICPSPMGMHGDAVVRELIADGYLGDLRFVRGNRISGGRTDPTRPIHWRERERFQGINTLAVGIMIERLHRWVGHARRVSARTATWITDRPARDGEGTVPVDLPDAVSIHCEFENGALGSFDFSHVGAHNPRNEVALFGSDGTLVYNFDDDRLMGATPEDDELTEIPISTAKAVEWSVEHDFIDAIKNGGSPRTTFQEGVKYMEFSEAVCRATEHGGEVTLPLRT